MQDLLKFSIFSIQTFQVTFSTSTPEFIFPICSIWKWEHSGLELGRFLSRAEIGMYCSKKSINPHTPVVSYLNVGPETAHGRTDGKLALLKKILTSYGKYEIKLSKRIQYIKSISEYFQIKSIIYQSLRSKLYSVTEYWGFC